MRKLARLVLLMGALPAAKAAYAAQPDASLIKRGEYLATAADCAACHTNPGGTAFAGERYMQTPFGQIASSNITPDRDTGIGTWSDDDFYRALHNGIRKDGAYIYPVMPFTAFTKMTRDDVLAVKAYLFSLPPAHSPAKPNKLPFPLNQREALVGWRALYFKPSEFKPEQGKPAGYNRGAYLVEALAHCGMCHTARTVLGGPSAAAFQGGEVQGWYAPNLTADVREGLGKWSEADIVTYLKTGTAPGKGVAAGPMRETVHDSLSKLTDSDLQAIAVYLKTIPAAESDKQARNSSAREGQEAESVVYLNYCASCHQQHGQGLAGAVPNLAKNEAVTAAGPQNVYRAVLGGLPATHGLARMPSFAGALTNQQIADVTNYVRTAWGNNAPANATLEGVASERKNAKAYMSGVKPECPTPTIVTAAYKAATAGDSGLSGLLQSITAENIFATADAAIAKLHAEVPNADKDDILNALYDARCKVLDADTKIPLEQKRWELTRWADVVYVRQSGTM